ncbi:DUF1684 domain-containing protein [Paenibacillus sp. YIM B09110]|uniref:DUF1684 domain-containing protein n=1 Tax=Paenibacillus sp. YIM B09110 TaxID=3126102 RepID=UPI00301D10CB
MKQFEEWRAERNRSVADYQGDLALIAMHSITSETRVEGLPGLWQPTSPDKSGLTLTASAEEAVMVDGKLLDGTVSLIADQSVVCFSSRMTAVATEQPGSNHLLAIYDAESEGVRSFDHISSFAYDPTWVIEGELVVGDEGRTVSFSHNADEAGFARQHQSPGDIRFERDGSSYVLSPFVSGHSLIVVFGDKTNGHETYGMGRMLLVSVDAEGKVKLDFNRAFLPPCAFSYYFNCPMPPANNRLPFEVKAGEQQVMHRDNGS